MTHTDYTRNILGCIINSVGECKFTTLFLFIKKT